MSFGRVINTIVEDVKELTQGNIVHPVDSLHLDDTEIENGTTSSDGSESLTLDSDFFLSDSSFFERLLHFSGFSLDVTEHINEFGIIEERSFGVSQSLEKISLELG